MKQEQDSPDVCVQVHTHRYFIQTDPPGLEGRNTVLITRSLWFLSLRGWTMCRYQSYLTEVHDVDNRQTDDHVYWLFLAAAATVVNYPPPHSSQSPGWQPAGVYSSQLWQIRMCPQRFICAHPVKLRAPQQSRCCCSICTICCVIPNMQETLI